MAQKVFGFMDLKQLQYFVRVAELGSFTRAAIELDVAQPALSRQVRLLEVELRQNLLVRNGRGAVPSSVARSLTVPLTRAFREQLPEARLSISEGLSSALQEGLVSGRLDIAVLYNAQPSRELDLAPLLEEELVLVRARPPGLQEDPPPGPIGLAEVAQLPLVIPTRPNAVRMHVEAEMADIGCRPNVVLEIDGVSAILDLVLDGAGCAILSRNAVLNSPRPSAYAMRPIGAPPLRVRLSLATSLQRPATPVQKATLDLIRAKAPAVVAHAL